MNQAKFLNKMGTLEGYWYLARFILSTFFTIILLVMLVPIVPILWIRIVLYICFGGYYAIIVYALYKAFVHKKKMRQ